MADLQLKVEWAAPLAVLTTSVGLVVGWLYEGAGYDRASAIILVAVLLFVSLSQTVTLRFFVLPANAKIEGGPQSPQTVAFAFAHSIAIYGLVAAVMTGQGLLALPFGALSLLATLVCWLYLREVEDELPKP